MSEDEKSLQMAAAWRLVKEHRHLVACWQTKLAGLLRQIPQDLTLDTVGVDDEKTRLCAHGEPLPEWPSHGQVKDAALHLAMARKMLAEAEELWEPFL